MDPDSEIDGLLREVADARSLVRVARVRLQTARLRAEGPWAESGGGRALLRARFQRLALGDGAVGSGGAPRS